MKTTLSVIGLSCLMVLAPIFGWGLKLVKKTTSATTVISNYEWFYDQYNQIEAMRMNIASISETINTCKGEERQRKNTELQGLKLVLNNSIAEYNSKSRQITRKLWKSETLPYQLEMNK